MQLFGTPTRAPTTHTNRHTQPTHLGEIVVAGTAPQLHSLGVRLRHSGGLEFSGEDLGDPAPSLEVAGVVLTRVGRRCFASVWMYAATTAWG